MKIFKQHISVFVFICFLGNSFSAFALDETDTAYEFFKHNLKYLPVPDNTQNVKYVFSENVNFELEFHRINSGLFLELLPGSKLIFQKLKSYDVNTQKKILFHFLAFQKETEKLLQQNNLPAGMEILPLALSALNNRAVHQKRAGIWQLTHFQAVLNGLIIDKLVDERLLSYQSSRVAFTEIKHNYDHFKNYDLAVLAFLCGRTKVKNTLYESVQNSDVSEILMFSPKNVKETIALFQALLVYLKTNRAQIKTDPFQPNVYPDTVWVNRQIHFKQIEKVLSISANDISELNPQYKFRIIPEKLQPHKLILPSGKWDDFVLWQDSVYKAVDSTLFEVVTQKIEYPPAPNRQYVGEPVKDLEIEGKTKIQYRIKTGDVLGIIAEKYHVRVSDLKYWNNIFNERRIQAGQKINIFVDKEKADFYQAMETEPKVSSKSEPVATKIKNGSTLQIFAELEQQSKKIEHVVKSGESPFHIAKKYAGVTPEAILEWNNIDDPRKIQIGQKLIIYLEK